MADIMSQEERSERMSRIRSKDTNPELIVRKALWARGFRYRLHARDLPGKPDMVFPSLRTVVLVHGCYWHGHACQKGRIPRANSGFWEEKFTKNKARDRRNKRALAGMGWDVVIVWECQLATRARRERTLALLVRRLATKRGGRGRTTLDRSGAACDNRHQARSGTGKHGSEELVESH